MRHFFKKNTTDPRATSTSQPDAMAAAAAAAAAALAGKTKEDEPAPKTGLDKFKEIMDNANRIRNEQKAEADKSQAPKPTTASALLTPENLANLKASTRFTDSIPQELAERIANNDATAIIEAMGTVASEAYSMALQQNAMLTDTVTQSHVADLANQMDERVHTTIKDSKYKDAIPNFDNPIISMGLEAFVKDARVTNPDATPEEINALAAEYISTLNEQLNPDKGGSDTDTNDPDSDDPNKGSNWMDYITGPD